MAALQNLYFKLKDEITRVKRNVKRKYMFMPSGSCSPMKRTVKLLQLFLCNTCLFSTSVLDSRHVEVKRAATIDYWQALPSIFYFYGQNCMHMICHVSETLM